jgi:glycosyltransferase involved in cell wall biosynthesis
MRILILSQWCFPEPDAKALVFAKELSRKGHSVQILTGFPNYPGGKLYPGYRVKFSQKEVIDGIEILRVPLYPDHSTSSIKRLINYVSFAFTASVWGVFWVKRADVMYVYHPPATIAVPALIIKLFRKIPVVYDIQDMWPDTLESTGMLNNKVALNLVDLYCRIVYRYVDHLVVLSQGFEKRLVQRSVPAAKVSVIYNWTVITDLPSIENKSLIPGAEKKFTILFAGTMGKAQSLDTVLEAARIVRERGNNSIQFVFIGGGICVEQLKALSVETELENVVFLDRVSADKIGGFLLAADVLLVHLKNDPLFEITIPSKTQAYMQAGKPILMAVKGDAQVLVEKAKAGVVCAPENPAAMAEAALALAALPSEELVQLGQNGKTFYQCHLSLEKGTSNFLKVFNSVAKNVSKNI